MVEQFLIKPISLIGVIDFNLGFLKLLHSWCTESSLEVYSAQSASAQDDVFGLTACDMVISGLLACTSCSGKDYNFQRMHSDVSSGNSTLAVASFRKQNFRIQLFLVKNILMKKLTVILEDKLKCIL
jgi:hypothetical protein